MSPSVTSTGDSSSSSRTNVLGAEIIYTPRRLLWLARAHALAVVGILLVMAALGWLSVALRRPSSGPDYYMLPLFLVFLAVAALLGSLLLLGAVLWGVRGFLVLVFGLAASMVSGILVFVATWILLRKSTDLLRRHGYRVGWLGPAWRELIAGPQQQAGESPQ